MSTGMNQTSRQHLWRAVAMVCQSLGWNATNPSCLEVMTSITEKYIMQLGRIAHQFTDHYGRTKANFDDVGLAFREMGVNLSDLEEYLKYVDIGGPPQPPPVMPHPKASNLNFPNPRSQEIQNHREEHVYDYLPYMMKGLEDEVEEETMVSPTRPVATLTEDQAMSGHGSPGSANGEKRSLTSPAESSVAKRARLGNYLPEEAGHSMYEMTSVMMSPNGLLNAYREGKLPDARTPPPGNRPILSSRDPSVKGSSDAALLAAGTEKSDVNEKENVRGKSSKSGGPDSAKSGGSSGMKHHKKELLKHYEEESAAKQASSKAKPGKLKAGGKSKMLSIAKLKKDKSKADAEGSSKLKKLLLTPGLDKHGKKVKLKHAKPPLALKIKKKKATLPGSGKISTLVIKPPVAPEARMPHNSGDSMDTLSSTINVDDASSGSQGDSPRLVIAESEVKSKDVDESRRLASIDDTLDSVVRNAVMEMEERDKKQEQLLIQQTAQARSPIKPMRVKVSKALVEKKEKKKRVKTKSFSTVASICESIDNVVEQSKDEVMPQVGAGQTAGFVGGSGPKDAALAAMQQTTLELSAKKARRPSKTGKGKSKKELTKEKLQKKLQARQDSLDPEKKAQLLDKFSEAELQVYEFTESPDFHPLSTSPQQAPASPPTPPPAASPPAPPPVPTFTVKVEAPQPEPPVMPPAEEDHPPLKPLKIDLGKDKQRERSKEHKKDKKDKKKDKEKKKKNKDKNKEKSKDRDERKEGDLSPTYPKIKIKFGSTPSVTTVEPPAPPPQPSPAPSPPPPAAPSPPREPTPPPAPPPEPRCPSPAFDPPVRMQSTSSSGHIPKITINILRRSMYESPTLPKPQSPPPPPPLQEPEPSPVREPSPPPPSPPPPSPPPQQPESPPWPPSPSPPRSPSPPPSRKRSLSDSPLSPPPAKRPAPQKKTPPFSRPSLESPGPLPIPAPSFSKAVSPVEKVAPAEKPPKPKSSSSNKKSPKQKGSKGPPQPKYRPVPVPKPSPSAEPKLTSPISSPQPSKPVKETSGRKSSMEESPSREPKPAPAKKKVSPRKASPQKKTPPSSKVSPERRASPTKKSHAQQKVSPVREPSPSPERPASPSPVRERSPSPFEPVSRRSPSPPSRVPTPDLGLPTSLVDDFEFDDSLDKNKWSNFPVPSPSFDTSPPPKAKKSPTKKAAASKPKSPKGEGKTKSKLPLLEAKLKESTTKSPEIEVKEKAKGKAEAKEKGKGEVKDKSKAEVKDKSKAEVKDKSKAEVKEKAKAEGKDKGKGEAKEKKEKSPKQKEAKEKMKSPVAGGSEKGKQAGAADKGGDKGPPAPDVVPPIQSSKSKVITEILSVIEDANGVKIWFCPTCKQQDDGSPMIGCDLCDDWYHWTCQGITQEPPEEESWYCPRCISKKATASKPKAQRGRKRKKKGR